MFERVFVETLETSRRSWTVSVSALAQGVVLGVGVLIPLLSGLELPVGQWAAHLLAPVPPSTPRSPATEQRSKVVPRADLSAVMPTLSAIPDRAAAIIDTTDGVPAIGISGLAGASVPTGVWSGFGSGRFPAAVPPPAPPFEPESPKAARSDPVRVGGNVQRAKLTSQPMPRYPLAARQARIQGLVRLEAVIAENGSIRSLQVLSGHPFLIRAALESVKQWRYRPTLLNGEPVAVITQIDVRFTLTG